ncbi:rRNA biogenesis protein rrp36 [Neonectria magnoliae]|uniref:rRNA biogenesis protein RRP36 n=1 Tax=Neonectria magnoliae TaxID=2732573 RepID=A0ABR1H6E1_9HYPO
MVSKRKIGSTGLQRRVRPRREDDWEMDPKDGEASSSDDDQIEEQTTRRRDRKDVGNDDEESGSEAVSGSDQESEDDDPEPAAQVNLTSISFGALVKAQATLPPSERKSKTSKTTSATTTTTASAAEPPPPRKTTRGKYDPTPKRSSKHAPQEQSSKRPVSRLREIIPDPRRPHRDPRFEPFAGPLDEAKANKAYAFLDEFRDSEMAELRVQIKKTKDPDAKDALKRQLLSMESKKKSRLRREEADNLLIEHRKREKDLVAQGKTPFYLKKSEQKKQILVDRFASMSKGQVDRAIERKRKKVAGKEKKEMGALERIRPRG